MAPSPRMLLAALSCAAVLAGGTAARAAEIGYCGFDDPGQTSTLGLGGSAAMSSGVLRLTPNDVFGETGAAWAKTPYPLGPATSFEAELRTRIHPNTGASGGAGLAFVLQNAGPTALGTDGAAMGLDGVLPSVAVTLDTEQNAGDPSGNFVAIVVNGVRVASASAPFALENGEVTTTWVDYDAALGSMRVFVSQSGVKPALPLVTAPVDVYSAVVAAAHGDSAYVGFTAGTSATGKNQHDVLSWTLGALEPDAYPSPSGLATCPRFPVQGGSCDCQGTTGALCGRTCSAGTCTMVTRTGKRGTFFCNGAGTCDVFCESGSTCNVICNSSDCAVHCRPGATCNVGCNAASCSVQCEPGSTCNGAFNASTAVVDCPEGATCNNASCSATSCTTYCAPGACSYSGGCGACTREDAHGSQCVGCVTDAECKGSPSTPACQPSGFCGECSATNTTRCAAPLSRCDVAAGRCVECNSDGDCGGATPLCTEHVCTAPPVADAGADSGAADGGSDGGADAGRADAGAGDGGSLADGGRRDGGAGGDASDIDQEGVGIPADDFAIEGAGCACSTLGGRGDVAPWGALGAAAAAALALVRRRKR